MWRGIEMQCPLTLHVVPPSCFADELDCGGKCIEESAANCGACGLTCSTPGPCETVVNARCNHGMCRYKPDVGAQCTTPGGSPNGVCQYDKTCVGE